MAHKRIWDVLALVALMAIPVSAAARRSAASVRPRRRNDSDLIMEIDDALHPQVQWVVFTEEPFTCGGRAAGGCWEPATGTITCRTGSSLHACWTHELCHALAAPGRDDCHERLGYRLDGETPREAEFRQNMDYYRLSIQGGRR